MSTEVTAPARPELSAVFDPATCSEIRRRYGDLDEYARPAVFSAALEPSRFALRKWLDHEVGRLDADGRAHVLNRLRGADSHSAALAELTGLALLRDAGGFTVALDPELDGLTPDLLAYDAVSNAPVLIAEVWTRSVSIDVVKAQRGWTALRKAVAKIRVPALLSVSVSDLDRSDPPGKIERDRIVDHLRTHLPRCLETGWMTTCHGLTFEVVGRTQQSVRLLPVSTSRSIDRDHVVDAIETKVSRYRKLAERLALPLLVLLATEPRTGLDAAVVGDVLAGKNMVVVNFDRSTVGSMKTRNLTLRKTNAPPVFSQALSAVGFIDVHDGHDAELTIWPIVGSRRQLPAFADDPRVRVLAHVGVEVTSSPPSLPTA
ncbi:hypothetical protein GALL_379350 [mine drainage metagenome]|uniref:Uncharacterized protein n=1 Tax=mine drainage metagenome TaxID=410659 RepID=A0A1J5QWP9_9ZZZZ